ncbi:MAG: NAD(P)/FAD-dependent oxidoreductase [Acholeplasmataceae bacterium]|jgi:predicted Rossmann fold flavoprotein|nr:NAD(P)/FAD-dependent oxidoreductase [Acholeplasmataceae bacterium]
MKKVIVIGGGASGLMAAITAKNEACDVMILERNTKLGKKILATGNGRCNFTNVDATELHYNHPYFVKTVFEQMNPKKTLHYFETIGIAAKIEDEGKTYPLSEQASSIVDVLVYEVERLHIPVIYEAKVISIKKKESFHVTLENQSSYQADVVILATGGMAMPKSGSDGSGYALAEAFGHKLTPIFPALVKLELESPHLKALDGVKYPGLVELMHHNVSIQQEYGDVLFTKYGISGPTILQISRKANALLQENQEVFIKVILIQGLNQRDVAKRFIQLSEKTIEMSLIGLINKRIIHPLLKEAKIPFHLKVSELTRNQMNTLMKLLFDWQFKIIGSKDFDDAQVTAGGIDIKDINPQTLESKKIKGLYFCGEILDIDGLCGGYNLQWAWSSGYVCGIHASK